jgi:organic hydroperoxide reductase OsmC/OhrA
MSEHKAHIQWRKETADFTYETYDRTHTVRFEGGVSLKGSAAPEFLGNAKNVNPEELLAAALGGCHMLTFLAIAAKSRLVVLSYEDEVTAILDKNSEGKLAVTKVILRPKVVFDKTTPVDTEKLTSLHEKSHKNCFIANSVKCEMSVSPR